MDDLVTIRNRFLAARFAAKGAELVSLVPEDGREVMWSAEPEIWPWHAPNLFPIVGALAEDTLLHDGKPYPMKQHGFLRHSLCELISAEPDECAFRLVDGEATRAQYPFAFMLTLRYRLESEWLHGLFELYNPAETPLYASLGTHPAFRWPLAGGEQTDYRVLFERPEPEPIRRLSGRLLDPEPHPTPVEGRELKLDPALFDRDALIFDRLNSRQLQFGTPGGAAIELRFPDFPHFGIWTKPGGARFLCLEPWQGHVSPQGFAGEFADKPGVVALAPGATRTWRYAICAAAQMPGRPVL